MKEKPTDGSPIFGGICSGCIPEVLKVSVCSLLFTVAVSVNYTSEFWELYEAAT
jgi:hypothetical protein